VDLDGGIEEGDFATGGFGFGQGLASVGLVEEDLALEIGGFDEVAVDKSECADASTGEERGGGSSSGSHADDRDMGSGEKFLTWHTNAFKQDLAGVTISICDVFRCGFRAGFRKAAGGRIREGTGVVYLGAGARH